MTAQNKRKKKTTNKTMNKVWFLVALLTLGAIPSYMLLAADEQGGKQAETIEAVNVEANLEYPKTGTSGTMVPSIASDSLQYRTAPNEEFYCYCLPENKIEDNCKKGTCINCENDTTGTYGRCKVSQKTMVEGYEVPVGQTAVLSKGSESTGYIIGQEETLDNQGGSSLKNAFYRHWQAEGKSTINSASASDPQFSSSYPKICYLGYNGVEDTAEKSSTQFGERTLGSINSYNDKGYYVLRGYYSIPSGAFDYDFNDYTKVSGIQNFLIPNWQLKYSGAKTCVLPDYSKVDMDYDINKGKGDKYDPTTDTVKDSGLTLLPCGATGNKSGNGYNTNQICSDEYIKRYEDSEGNPLLTKVKGWLNNKAQNNTYKNGYETFDIPLNACYECKFASGEYCEEVVDVLIEKCNKSLDCVVKAAVTRPRSYDPRLPDSLNCSGCLSKLEGILKSRLSQLK